MPARKSTKTNKKPQHLHHRVAHHAKHVIRITPMFVHGLFVGAIIGVLVVVALRGSVASAVTITSPRDCDTNAVVKCGALTTTELQSHYKDSGVASIYSYFGISATDIASMGTTAVAGQVFKDGSITANGVVVATNAITAGRETIAGSTKVTSGGVTFYKRPPSVSFRPNYINAFIVMQNGQFKFAILGACSNPVVATPVPKATPKPTPPVTTPPSLTPAAPVVVTSTQSTQTPPSTPVATLASSTSITELPNTGPGAVAIITLIAVISGYAFHATHRHVRRKRLAAHHHPHAAH